MTITTDLLSQLPTENKLLILNYLVVFFETDTDSYHSDNKSNENNGSSENSGKSKLPSYMVHMSQCQQESFLYENIQCLIQLSMVNTHWNRLLLHRGMIRLWRSCLYAITGDNGLIKRLIRQSKLEEEKSENVEKRQNDGEKVQNDGKTSENERSVCHLLKNECVYQWFERFYCGRRREQLSHLLNEAFSTAIDVSTTYTLTTNVNVRPKRNNRISVIKLKTKEAIDGCKALLLDDRCSHGRDTDSSNNRKFNDGEVGSEGVNGRNDSSNSDDDNTKKTIANASKWIQFGTTAHSDIMSLYGQLYMKYSRDENCWQLLKTLLSLFAQCGVRIYETFQSSTVRAVEDDMIRFCFFSSLTGNGMGFDEDETGQRSSPCTILVLFLRTGRVTETNMLLHCVSLLNDQEMDKALQNTEAVIDMPLEAYVSFRLDNISLSCLAPHIHRYRRSVVVEPPYSLDQLAHKFLSIFFSQISNGIPHNFKSIVKTMVQYFALDLNEKDPSGFDFLLKWFSYWRNSGELSTSLRMDQFMLDIVLFLITDPQLNMNIETKDSSGNNIMHYLVKENPQFHVVSPLFTNAKLKAHMLKLLCQENDKHRIPIEVHLEYLNRLPAITQTLELDLRILRLLCQFTDPAVWKRYGVGDKLTRVLQEKNVKSSVIQQLMACNGK